MSDLQLSLLALGAVIIAGVILFNWWQERRFIQDSIKRFDAPADDALMEDFHIDTDRIAGLDNVSVVVKATEEVVTIPEDATLDELHGKSIDSIDDLPRALEPEQAYSEPIPATVEPAIETEPEPVAAEAAEPPHLQQEQGGLPGAVDPKIDLTAVLTLGQPTDSKVLAAALEALPKFDKPTQWALYAPASGWQFWTADSAGEYTRLASALQLADRSGPASQGTLLAFQEQLADLASRLGAELEWYGSETPIEYAVELDQFCIGVDVMVGFHILQGSNGSFAGTKLRGLAEAGGLTLREDGAFHYCNAQGATLFSLVSQDQRPFKPETLRTVFYRGVSFQLDVPKVGNCLEAFNQMVLCAKQLELSLDGTLVDDNQRALGDAEIDKIRQQLSMIYSKMVSYGIQPGSPSALRLFS